MARTRAYLAASVDGYIADSKGGVRWLEPYQSVDYGFGDFISEIGAAVMGRATYEHSLVLDPDWTRMRTPVLVATSRPLPDPPKDVTAWTDGLPALARHLKKLKGKDVWIMGGAQLLGGLLDEGAVDRLELFLIPVLLGDGVPLFSKRKQKAVLTLRNVTQYDKGVTGLDYAVAAAQAGRARP